MYLNIGIFPNKPNRVPFSRAAAALNHPAAMSRILYHNQVYRKPVVLESMRHNPHVFRHNSHITRGKGLVGLTSGFAVPKGSSLRFEVERPQCGKQRNGERAGTGRIASGSEQDDHVPTRVARRSRGAGTALAVTEEVK